MAELAAGHDLRSLLRVVAVSYTHLNGTDRRCQSFGQAERYCIRAVRNILNRAAAGSGGVQNPRTVQMNAQSQRFRGIIGRTQDRQRYNSAV